jgi:hypothetical protein
MRNVLVIVAAVLAGFILGHFSTSVKAQSRQEVVLHKVRAVGMDGVPQPLIYQEGKQGQVVGFSCTNDACYVLTQ